MHEHAAARAPEPGRPPIGTRRAAVHPLTDLQRLAGNTAVAGALQRDAIPGFSQRGGTCQPASLLTAFLIWDRERASPGAPNQDVIAAIDAAQIYVNANRASLLATLPLAEIERITELLARTRATLSAPAGTLNEAGYQELATVMSPLFNSNAHAAHILGMETVDAPFDAIDGIFGSEKLTGLTPGQIAQIEWYVHTRVIVNGQLTNALGYHDFVIGRKGDGTWFLADQGPTPAFTLRAGDLGSLRAGLEAASKSGQSWIDTRPTTRRRPMEWTGVHVLTSPKQLEPRHRALLAPGVAIGTANTGWSLSRNVDLVTWDWVGMADGLAGAQALFPGQGKGHGFIVFELPKGVFNVMKTNPVSPAAFSGTFTPAGPLAASPRLFLSVWLQMGTADGTFAPALKQVY